MAHCGHWLRWRSSAKMRCMAALSETHVTLRFHGNDLDPDVLTAVVGGKPSRAKRMGDMRSAAAAHRGEIRERTGSWHLSAERRAPGDLDGQIEELFSQLTQDLSVWRDLACYQPNLFVGLFLTESNEGIEISAASLALLADRGILLGLDIYSSESESVVE